MLAGEKTDEPVCAQGLLVKTVCLDIMPYIEHQPCQNWLSQSFQLSYERSYERFEPECSQISRHNGHAGRFQAIMISFCHEGLNLKAEI